MKNNYFYTTLQEELALLNKAAILVDSSAVASCRIACEKLHTALCQHLFRAFVTPWNREDLYRLSVDILALFSPLSGAVFCSSSEKERIAGSGALLASLRLDERVLSLSSELNRLWGEAACSGAAQACRDGFLRLAEQAVVTALKNV